jgi:di/tricarboxylate transporter
MSSTAVTAIFIPVALRIAQGTEIPPSRLMIPISVAALISGMMTLVATAPNLVVNSELEHHGIAGFSFFSFTPFGVPILVLGIVYMAFARRWLPGDKRKTHNRPTFATWVDEYDLANREYRLLVTDRSPLAGKILEELNLRGSSGANIIAIERSRNFSRELLRPTAKMEIKVGDILLIDLFSDDRSIQSIQDDFLLEELPLKETYFSDRSQEIGLAEIIIKPSSDLVGRSVIEAQFRSRFGRSVIGLRRGRVVHDRSLVNERLEVGDMFLLVGAWSDIEQLRSDNGYLAIIRLRAELDEVLPVPGKALQAVACLALVVGLMVSGVIPNVHAALIGCLLMGLLECVDLPSGYRSIDWKAIGLIVGMLPFSIALQRTGGVDLAADFLMSVISDAGPRVVLGTLFIIIALLGMFISNTATAVLMAPVALAVAKDLNASPYPFAMIVALAVAVQMMDVI